MDILTIDGQSDMSLSGLILTDTSICEENNSHTLKEIKSL